MKITGVKTAVVEVPGGPVFRDGWIEVAREYAREGEPFFGDRYRKGR